METPEPLIKLPAREPELFAKFDIQRTWWHFWKPRVSKRYWRVRRPD